MTAKPFISAILIAVTLGLGLAACFPEAGSLIGDLHFGNTSKPFWPAGPVNIKARRAAAEQGDPEAQFTMGAVYDMRSRLWLPSDAPKKDDAIAAQWYRASANQGNGCGQFYLAGMYETGHAVERDDVVADMWYCLAISALHTTLADDATRKRDDIEKRITPEQIAEARRRAAEWKPS